MKKLLWILISLCTLIMLFSCDTLCTNHSRVTERHEATCWYEGDIIEYCENCLETLNVITLEKVDHTPSSSWNVVLEPTCTSEGTMENRCTVCNEITDTKSINTTEHSAGEWELFADYTCTINGTRVKKCVDCEEILETEDIPAAHRPTVLSAVTPTCANIGLTEGSKCSSCDEIFIAQEEIAKLDHNYETVEAVEPKCNAYGYTEGVQCTMCHMWDVPRNRIDKLSHTIVTINGTAATCTSNGRTDGKSCSVCHEIISQQSIIYAFGHDFSVYTNCCTRCSEKELPEIDTRNKFLEYDGDYNAVILLDKCVSVSNTSEYWIFNVRVDADYIRLVGTAGTEYNIRIEIDSSRKTDMTIDLVNVTLKSVENQPTIKSSAKTKLNLGLYGTECAIIGKNGSNGKNGSLGSSNGKNGGNGNNAISISGDLFITMATDSAKIKGGNGGNGGKGMDAGITPIDGANGGKGGNGAYAVSASSITVNGADGHIASSIILTGGTGGTGGNGGKGFVWKDDGKDGSDGVSQSATTVQVTYN